MSCVALSRQLGCSPFPLGLGHRLVCLGQSRSGDEQSQVGIHRHLESGRTASPRQHLLPALIMLVTRFGTTCTTHTLALSSGTYVNAYSPSPREGGDRRIPGVPWTALGSLRHPISEKKKVIEEDT